MSERAYEAVVEDGVAAGGAVGVVGVDGAPEGEKDSAMPGENAAVFESGAPRPEKGRPFSQAELERIALGNKARPVYRVFKRAFDVCFSLCVLAVCLLFWPVALLVLMVIAVQSRAFPLYAQRRVGRYGRHFGLLKLRSMVGDADDVEKYLSPEQLEQWERERKVDDDPRITPIGKIIRKTSVDEIPQFLNVLVGQMSIVGPRPIVDEEMANFIPSERYEVVSVRPGVTGWWQVTDRNDATWENGRRQALELYYVRNAGFGIDAEVFLRTFGVMFGKRKTGR